MDNARDDCMESQMNHISHYVDLIRIKKLLLRTQFGNSRYCLIINKRDCRILYEVLPV